MNRKQARYVCYLIRAASELEFELRQIANKDYIVWVNGVFLWGEDDWKRLKNKLINEARRVECASIA